MVLVFPVPGGPQITARLRLNEAEIQQLAALVGRQIPSAEQIFSKALGGKTLPLRF